MEADNILVSTRLLILRNYRVFQSDYFFSADHIFLLAALKLHINFKRSSSCNNAINPENLKKIACTHEYGATVVNRFSLLTTLANPAEP